MDSNMEKVLDKIQKLLALSENNPSPEEAAAAAARAEELMVKYNVTRYMVESSSGVEHKEPIIDGWKVGHVFESGSKVIWKQMLAVGVAEVNSCRIYYKVEPGKGGRRINHMCPIGTESDIVITKYLYLYLRDEIDRLCKRDNGGYGKTWANNFKMGATDVIIARLKEEHKKSIERVKGELSEIANQQGVPLVHVTNALAKLENKKSDIRKFMDGMNLTKSKTTHRTLKDLDGYAAGRAAGREISLQNKQLEAGRGKLKE